MATQLKFFFCLLILSSSLPVQAQICETAAEGEAAVTLNQESNPSYILKFEMVDWNYRPCQDQSQSLNCGYETWEVSAFESEDNKSNPLQVLTFDFEIQNNQCLLQK